MTVGRDPTTVSVGAGTLYVAAIGTAEPTSCTGVYATGWVDVGYTEAGTVFTSGLTVQPIMVDEEFYRVGTVLTDRSGTVAFALSQITATNLQTAFAGGTISTVVSGGYVTFTPPVAGTENRVMLSWKSKAGDEIYIWRQCFQTGSVASSRKKSTPQALLTVSFELEKPTGLQPWTWIGNTTSVVGSPNRSGS